MIRNKQTRVALSRFKENCKIFVKGERLPLIILIISLVIRIIWAVLSETTDPFLISNPLLGDAAAYHQIAVNILNGKGFSLVPNQPTSFWPPLYPFTLAVIFRIFSPNLVIARLFQALWGAIPPVIFFWIAAKHFDKNVALLTGIGLAIYPHLIYFGTWLIAEALFMMLFSFVLFSAAKFSFSEKYRWLILMGFFLGLSILTKPSVLFFAPLLALWVILTYNSGIKKRIAYGFVLTVATLLVVLPWSLRNYVQFGQFVLVSSNGGYTFLGANNPEAWGGHDEGFPPGIAGLNEAEMEKAYYTEAWQWIRSNPGEFIKLGIVKIQRLFSPLSVASQQQDYPIPGAIFVYIIYRLFFILAFIGMIIGLKQIRMIGYLYVPVVGVFLSTILYYGDARYTLPMVPSLVLFAALSLDFFMKRFSKMTLTKQRIF
jgi:4-amino-4-deoxy-L-arabinose transferase-like glycosyltransferase